MDINSPWKGSSDSHLDMWIGHSRKISAKINWRIQANIRNIGEDVGLVRVSNNSDGTVAFSRIQEGMVTGHLTQD